MGLLNPTPGEVVDRLTILELKITAAGKRNAPTAELQAEQLQLQQLMREHEQAVIEDCMGDDDLWETKQNQIRIVTNGLAAVNALLWECEDNVRELPVTEALKLAALAKQIARLNDNRATLKKELSELYGLKETEQKMYKSGL